MATLKYYELLLQGLPQDEALTVKDIIQGVSWTAAVLSDGHTGVAMYTAGDSAARMFDSLVGLPLCKAARAVLSWNMVEASEGLAVINAYYNTPERKEAFHADSAGGVLNGVELHGKRIVVIGHLVGHSGITEELLAPARKVTILERSEPRPGDLPDCACEFIVPESDIVLITGSAAINKTLPRLLELAQGKEVLLTGPSVTLCPELLSLGIASLHGLVITEPEGMLELIRAKRASINRFGKHFTVQK